jgi:hypothetical protein
VKITSDLLGASDLHDAEDEHSHDDRCGDECPDESVQKHLEAAAQDCRAEQPEEFVVELLNLDHDPKASEEERCLHSEFDQVRDNDPHSHGLVIGTFPAAPEMI